MTDAAAFDIDWPGRRSKRWRAGLLGVLLILLPGGFSLNDPPGPPAAPSSAPPVRAKGPPPVPAPMAEPASLMPVDPDAARAINAAVPFSPLPNPAARPFRFSGGDADRTRAADCMAAALWYEAGDDAKGEAAVAQVVLNRVRHPAFPKTVCGVVFQGADQPTGCQFTFTCDGALARTPSPAAWERARAIARAALSGQVFRPVGMATHYHTDWVVPYWSGSLDKVAMVGTHLFFRWKGWWGTPAAFRLADAGTEPRIALIARLSPAHADAPPEGIMQLPVLAQASEPAIPAAPVSAGAHFGTAQVVAASSDGASFILALDRRTPPADWQGQALALCMGRTRCKVMGWADPARTPGGFPVFPGLLDAMAYSYIRDPAGGIQRSLWNCDQFPRAASTDCMVKRNPARIAYQQAGPPPSPASAQTAP